MNLRLVPRNHLFDLIAAQESSVFLFGYNHTVIELSHNFRSLSQTRQSSSEDDYVKQPRRSYVLTMINA